VGCECDNAELEQLEAEAAVYTVAGSDGSLGKGDMKGAKKL
jgi:hypothetical protein